MDGLAEVDILRYGDAACGYKAGFIRGDAVDEGVGYDFLVIVPCD